MAQPAQIVMQLASSYWAARCLHRVAEHGVADALGEAPQSAAELAASLGLHAGALHRVLRVLVSEGIFELRDGRFSHNDASRALRTDVPGSMRAAARFMGLPLWWKSYGAMEHSLRTGLPAVESVVGENVFSYLGAHPDEAGIFAEAMQALSHALLPKIVAAYDFRGARVIGDVGGGLGHLLSAVLEAAPDAQGVLLDRPEVIQQAALAAHPRIRYVPGDFFQDPVPPCDLYLLKRVLHDWADPQAVDILRAVRKGAPQGARVLLVEGVLHEEDPGPLAHIDIEMLVMTGGRERTREEWERLLQEAGLRLQRIVPTGEPRASLLEAVVA